MLSKSYAGNNANRADKICGVLRGGAWELIGGMYRPTVPPPPGMNLFVHKFKSAWLSTKWIDMIGLKTSRILKMISFRLIDYQINKVHTFSSK